MFTYLIFSWIGFWLGHFVGYIFSFTIANLGPLRLGTATIGSILILGLGYWLSLVEAEEGDF